MLRINEKLGYRRPEARQVVAALSGNGAGGDQSKVNSGGSTTTTRGGPQGEDGR